MSRTGLLGKQVTMQSEAEFPAPQTPTEAVLLDIVKSMEHVEAFRDLVMTETTPEEKFGLMGEIVGSILLWLREHPAALRDLLLDARAGQEVTDDQ